MGSWPNEKGCHYDDDDDVGALWERKKERKKERKEGSDNGN